MKLTEEQIIYVKENYAKIGRWEIAKNFQVSPYSIYTIAKKYGIRYDKSISYDKNCNKNNVDKLIKDFTPESAYILGFIWADGYISRGSRSYSINLSIKYEDGILIKDIIYQIADWKTYIYQPGKHQRNNNQLMQFHMANKMLFQFLENNDYRIKSGASADKILNVLPENLHKYWIRGYFDGDGSAHFNIPSRSNSITFTSCYHQNWNFLINILNKLSIEFCIMQTVQKNNNKFSRLVIRKIKSIYKLYQFLYNNELPNLGLLRKRDKIKSFFDQRQNNLVPGLI